MGRKGLHEELVNAGVPFAMNGKLEELTYNQHAALTGAAPSNNSIKSAREDLTSMDLQNPIGPKCPASKMLVVTVAVEAVYSSGVSLGKMMQHAQQLGESKIFEESRLQFQAQLKEISIEKNDQISKLQGQIEDLNNRLSTLTAERDDHRDELIKTRADLKQALAAKEGVRLELKSALDGMQEAEFAHKQEIIARDTEVCLKADISRRLDGAQRILAAIKDERDKARAQLASARTESLQASARYQESLAELNERLLCILNKNVVTDAVIESRDATVDHEAKSSKLDLA